jgi:hypothetical protein
MKKLSKTKKVPTKKVPKRYSLEGRKAETDRLYQIYLAALQNKQAT